MSSITNVGAGASLPPATASSTKAGVGGGDTTSTVTDANGSVTTTVTGPTGAVLSVSTTQATAGKDQRSAAGSVKGGGSPGSAGLLDTTA